MQKSIVALILLVTAGTVEVFGAEGAPVPPESRVKADAVRGCKAEFYDFPHWIPKGIDSLADAKAFVSANKPTLTETVNCCSISFPPDKEGTVNCDRTSLGAYLYGEAGFAAMLKAAEEKKTPVPARLKDPVNQRSIFIYSGFVNVAKAGTYALKMPVDDGDELTIGGVVVHSKTTFGGMTNPQDPAYQAAVTFREPGIYPIQVLHWDREQELGIHLYCDMDPKGEILANLVLLPLMRKPSDSDK
ncbi:MAG: hypothetical protein NTW87_09710 [Planctomycetota bacterium]|nr:hypothetical protein [Planctomycetota bacterium]